MAFKHKRVRVERGLYRSGDVYWACATAPGSRDAQWKKLGPIGIQAARRGRDEFAYRLRTGMIPATSQKITVRELSEEWFRKLDELETSGELRPRTLDSYQRGIRLHFLATWGSRDIRSMTADDFVTWHDRQRASGAAAWSIRARWIAIRGMFGYAARVGYLQHNPCDVLTHRERPKPGRSRARYLDDGEIEALLGDLDENARLITALLILTGTRVSEALGLTWGDLDLVTGQIHVRFQMSRQGERVPLKTEAARRDVILMTELGRLLRTRKVASRFSDEDDLILVNGVGRTLGYTRLRRAFAAAAERAGAGGATPHSCRHTFASILIDQGRSVEFVSQQLGHASTKTTWDVYVHLFRAKEQADVAKTGLDAAFGHMLRPRTP